MNYTSITFLDVLNDYSAEHSSNHVANVRSALYRGYGKGLQGRKTNKTRFTKEMMMRMEKAIERHPINLSDFERQYHLQIFEKGCDLMNISIQNRHSLRSYFKRLLDFVEQKYLIPQPAVQPVVKAHTVRKKIMDKSYIEEQKVKKPKRANIALSQDPKDFLDRLQTKYPNLTDNELLEIANKSLNKIEQVYQEMREFQRRNKVRDVSIETRFRFLSRLMGLWYEFNKNVAIDDFSIESMIPVINTNKEEINSNLNAIYVEEGQLRNKAKNEAKRLIQFLNKFYIYCELSNRNTSNKYIDCLTMCAKFLYQDVTDTMEYSDYEDITVINYLKVFRKNKNKTLKESAPQPLPLSWDEVDEVAKALKRDYDKAKYEYIYHKYSKKYVGTHEKTEAQKAKQLQAFLIISLFSLIPPKRQRIVRELTMGKTLKFGTLDRNGWIIPLDPQNDPNSKGVYILDLGPDDHKNGSRTGRSYQEVIPNRDFGDGTCFYDYLNQWLFKYRQVLVKTDVKTVFVREIKGDAFNKDSIRQKIYSIFKTKTGVGISPHLIRHIFVTHLADNNVDFSKRKAAAISMGHDPKTAEKYYCRQTDEQAILPIIEYMDSNWINKRNEDT